MTEHTLICTISTLTQTLENIEMCGGKNIQAALIDEGRYKVTYNTGNEGTTLVEEYERLKERVHNLNLFLHSAREMMTKPAWEALCEKHSGLPGYSETEAQNA